MPIERPRLDENSDEPVKSASVSWFPPHMYRAHKRLAHEIKHIDVVLEMRDARLPEASGNPELERLIDNRRRLLLFNKAALADPAQNRRWQDHYRAQGRPALFLDAQSGKGLNLIYPLIRELVAPTQETLIKRGIRPPMQRLMVIGMPNIGKSTLINRMAGGKKLKTAPEPGVTKGVSWVQLKGKFLLMDTPGVMLPKLEDMDTALRLGWIGTIRDKIIGPPRLAVPLLQTLAGTQPEQLAGHYGIAITTPDDGSALLESIAARRGMLLRGGTADLFRAAELVLADFRAGLLGRITLQPAP
ncbi:MAG: ribosome biogenesis GTPase YlqF [SAR324 cluster bacterium]|nr:ribosome biogenesis GTPase YlqF [SAR324 cluster bacterium]